MIIPAAVFLCFIAGCGGAAHEIVGKWRTAGDANSVVWEFSSDGSLSIGKSQGRYSFGSQNRVKIETPFATSVYEMEFWGDRMTLRDLNGSRLEFTRVK